jgi:hypothetical protein
VLSNRIAIKGLNWSIKKKIFNWLQKYIQEGIRSFTFENVIFDIFKKYAKKV